MKTFASQADLKAKKIRFQRLLKSCWAFTAEGDPNSGVIVGDNGVMARGRGPALTTSDACEGAIRYTRDFVRGVFACARQGVKTKRTLKQVYKMTRRRMDPKYAAYPIYEHCIPFDVSRAYGEARGIRHPRIWTAKRDREMWQSIA